MRDLFMSYSRRNKRFVEKLVADLREHHIDVWLDTIDLEVGDAVHLTIERAIEECRFFCIALSPASIASYYVREVEFEQAFARMVREQRESYILPIIVQRLTEPLPPRLARLHHLDFTNRKQYIKNMRSLAKKVRLQNEDYSGRRWYKSLEISPFGEPTGIGEMTQLAPMGSSYCITWEHGTVTQVDVYMNAERINYKKFDFDDKGRVIKNMMYSPAAQGDWKIIEDVWYYTYDPDSGRRIRKFVDVVGKPSGRELIYDGHNHVVEENIISTGDEADYSYGYARKTFEYFDGHVVQENWFDQDGNLISVDDRVKS